jgi:hypothetical protein
VKFLEFTITCKEWGTRRVLRPLPSVGDPWGILAPLRETPLRPLIPEVSGEAMSHALHGHVTPLMREIGPDPSALLRRAARIYPECAERKQCIAKSDRCVPSPKLPECFMPEGCTPELAEIIVRVLLSWKEGRYVVVVVGDEFSL